MNIAFRRLNIEDDWKKRIKRSEFNNNSWTIYQLEDGNNCKPSSEMIETWKKNNTLLYHVTYEFKIEEQIGTSNRVILTEEIQKLIE